MEDSLLELFCDIDDFCQQFVPEWNRIQRSRNWSATPGLFT